MSQNRSSLKSVPLKTYNNENSINTNRKEKENTVITNRSNNENNNTNKRSSSVDVNQRRSMSTQRSSSNLKTHKLLSAEEKPVIINRSDDKTFKISIPNQRSSSAIVKSSQTIKKENDSKLITSPIKQPSKIQIPNNAERSLKSKIPVRSQSARPRTYTPSTPQNSITPRSPNKSQMSMNNIKSSQSIASPKANIGKHTLMGNKRSQSARIIRNETPEKINCFVYFI